MRIKHGADGNEPIEPARSRLMASIGPKDTHPELVVRRMLHSMGCRFRLHAKELPGRPDIVLRPRRKAVFVHGCFWHAHPGCRKATIPKTRTEFWTSKLEANRRRDERSVRELAELGWDVLIVWECEIRDRDALHARLRSFLSSSADQPKRSTSGTGTSFAGSKSPTSSSALPS